MSVTETELAAPTQIAATPGQHMAVSETPGGTQISVDPMAPTAAQVAAPTEIQSAWLKSVPEAYSKEPWIAEIAKQENPGEAFFKEFQSQRSLVGRKGEGLKVPEPNAPAEQWQEFHKAIGVPEKPDDYIYEAPKAPEGMEAFFQTDEALLKAMRSAAHKAGVTPDGWKEITGAFDGYYNQSLQESLKQADTQLKAAEETFKKHYGDKSPQVLANFDKATSNSPDWAKPILNALQPATKAAIASVLFNFSSKYVSEDKLDISGLNTPSAMSSTEYGDAYAAIFAKLRETSHNPQSSEHLKAKNEMAQLRARGSEVFKGG